MSTTDDGLDDVLDPNAPDPNAPDPNAPDPNATAPDNAALEAERQRVADLQRQLEEQGRTVNDLREQFARQVPADPNEGRDPNDAYWQDPTGSTQRVVDQRLNEVIAPQAAIMNEKLGRIAVSNFVATKAGLPLFAYAKPLFDKEMAKIPMAALGAATDANIQQMLAVAWDAAVGRYVQERQAAQPPKPVPPPNLGGGGRGGGGGSLIGKKTLAELDPTAYRWAVNAKMSEEQMQKLADEVLAERELEAS